MLLQSYYMQLELYYSYVFARSFILFSTNTVEVLVQ